MGRTKGRMAGIPGIRPESTTEQIKAIMAERNKTTTRARKLERNRKAQAQRKAARDRDQDRRALARAIQPPKTQTVDSLPFLEPDSPVHSSPGLGVSAAVLEPEAAKPRRPRKAPPLRDTPPGVDLTGPAAPPMGTKADRRKAGGGR